MKRIRLALPLCLSVTTLSFAAAGPPFPAFTADMEMKASGTTRNGKVAFANGKMRTEMPIGDKTMTSIVDYGQSKVFILMPPPMGCMEQAIKKDRNDPFVALVENAKEEVLGEETIDGHPTKKVRVTSTADGTKHTSLLWKAQDLKGLPLRVAAEDGSFEMNYKNVKLGEPDKALLTPPADCKANPFGAAMEGMRQQGAPKAK